MPGTKISSLQAVTNLSPIDQIPLARNGTTYKIYGDQLTSKNEFQELSAYAKFKFDSVEARISNLSSYADWEFYQANNKTNSLSSYTQFEIDTVNNRIGSLSSYADYRFSTIQLIVNQLSNTASSNIAAIDTKVTNISAYADAEFYFANTKTQNVSAYAAYQFNSVSTDLGQLLDYTTYHFLLDNNRFNALSAYADFKFAKVVSLTGLSAYAAYEFLQVDNKINSLSAYADYEFDKSLAITSNLSAYASYQIASLSAYTAYQFLDINNKAIVINNALNLRIDDLTTRANNISAYASYQIGNLDSKTDRMSAYADYLFTNAKNDLLGQVAYLGTTSSGISAYTAYQFANLGTTSSGISAYAAYQFLNLNTKTDGMSAYADYKFGRLDNRIAGLSAYADYQFIGLGTFATGISAYAAYQFSTLSIDAGRVNSLSAYADYKFATVNAVAGGDLNGNYPNPRVAKINNMPVTNTANPITGHVLTWDGTSWIAAVPPGFNGSAGNGGALIGSVTYFSTPIAPVGWLECKGQSISKTANNNIYADLFGVIGYQFGGSGDSFTLPDLRGEFLRGWDHGRGADNTGVGVSRVFGSNQSEMIGPHSHPASSPAHTHAVTDPGHAHAQKPAGGSNGGGNNNYFFTGSTTDPNFQTGSSATGISIGSTAASVSVDNNTGTENRPRNVALLPCICYASVFGGNPTGPAGGDLSGVYPNPTVAKIQGVTVTGEGGNILTIGGTLKATADIIGYSTSDERLKKNITTISNALEKVSNIRGVEYQWDIELQDTYEGEDVGVLAQEIEKVLPSAVADRESGYKAVKYEKIIPLLIEAIKELKAEIEILKSK